MSEKNDIQAINVAFQIIDEVANSKTPISAAEISRKLIMTPPRAWRYINSLEGLGIIENSPNTKGYILGWKLRQLGQSSINKISLHEIGHFHLEKLKDKLLETVYLSVPFGDGATVIMSLDGGDGTYVSIHVAQGAYFHPTSTPSGRLILAFSTEEKFRRIIAKGLSQEGPDPIQDLQLLKSRLELIRKRNFDTSINVSAKMRSGRINLNSIAAPIFDKDNKICATIGVLTGLVEEEILSDKFLTPVLDCAKDISKSMGSTLY